MSEAQAVTKEIPIMHWDDWKNHPTWLTRRQLKEKGLMPQGDPIAQVWYGNKYLKRRGLDGYYIPLFDADKAQPKAMSTSRRAGIARGKETAKANRTCIVCGRLNKTKIKHTPKLCNACYDLQSEIEQARAWLADPNAVIVDSETTDLLGEIIDIAILRVDGKVLLNTYIKPERHIDERLSVIEEAFDGYKRERLTAYAIHGISNDMVKDAPRFTEVWGQIQTLFLFRQILVFNVEFDFGRIVAMIKKHKYTCRIPGKWSCVMRWYTAYHGEWSNYYRDYKFVGLSAACSEAGVKITDDMPAHSALGDCMRTLELIKAIAAKQTPMEKEKQVGQS